MKSWQLSVVFLMTLVLNLSAQNNTFLTSMDKLKWEKVMPGIWKASFGESGLDPFDFACPPKWGLGFWHRTPTTFSDKDVYEEIEAFKAHDFPLHVIGLEPGWQSFAYPCSFDWSEERFSDPKGFVKNLDEEGIKVNIWENPYVGAASKNFVIYSDYYGHEGYVTALTNSSLAGVLWTPEIRSAKFAEEWVRRFQTVFFSPMMQLNAWASGKKPWSYDGATDIARETIKLRLRLLPYLYTVFYDYNQKGIPPFRAMVLESGYSSKEEAVRGKLDGEVNPYAKKKRMERTDQYMMGPSVLVAPFFAAQKQRDVVLPKGNWYDFYIGDFVGNGTTIKVEAKLEQIPLDVKDGAIIPMLASEDILNEKNLQVRHYGSKENTYQLYNDDGESYNFEKGDYTITELKVEKDRKGNLKGKSKASDKDFPYDDIEWVWMTME